MTDFPMLQAHRGVSTEYPENTMAAFEAAVQQGYGMIELDPAHTSDGLIVVLHDKTLNRTARYTDGSPLKETVTLTEITYTEALQYDFGIGFARKFASEPLPLLEDVLRLAREHGVKVKLNSKIERFPPAMTEVLYRLIEKYEPCIGITTARPEMIRFYAARFPAAELHYDGAVDDAALRALAPFGDRLTVWMPYRSPLTSWVKVPYADGKLCRAVKRIARLGIWILKDYESFDAVCAAFVPDIVETTGAVKPVRRTGFLCDMHVHSQNSHDSTCPVQATAEAAEQKGISAFAVTDHSDFDLYECRDVARNIAESVKAASEAAAAFSGHVKVLRGVEIGEGFWYPELERELLGSHSFDIILGSVHSVRIDGLRMPYSVIDFSAISVSQLTDYMRQYFDDVYEMLQHTPCDVMSHLTCPLRYINGKYGRGMDIHLFEEQIDRILTYIRDHGIAMEVNTSGLGTSFGQLMPDEWIIRKFREIGGHLVTLGSDAHTAENIGREFSEALRILKACGYRNYYYYEGRRCFQCAL